MSRIWVRAWGEATAFLRRSRGLSLADLVVLAALGGLVVALSRVAHGWTGELRPAVQIDLSPAALELFAATRAWMELTKRRWRPSVSPTGSG